MKIKILKSSRNSLTYIAITAFHALTGGYDRIATDGNTTIYGNKNARRAITPVSKVPADKRRKATFEVMDYFM